MFTKNSRKKYKSTEEKEQEELEEERNNLWEKLGNLTNPENRAERNRIHDRLKEIRRQRKDYKDALKQQPDFKESKQVSHERQNEKERIQARIVARELANREKELKAIHKKTYALRAEAIRSGKLIEGTAEYTSTSVGNSGYGLKRKNKKSKKIYKKRKTYKKKNKKSKKNRSKKIKKYDNIL